MENDTKNEPAWLTQLRDELRFTPGYMFGETGDIDRETVEKLLAAFDGRAPKPSGSPMDPERLDSTFGHLRSEDPGQDSPFCMWTDTAVRELLADRDHHEANASNASIQAADLKLRLDDALASLASMTEVANKAQRSNRKLEREIFGARELLAPRSRLHPDRSLADHIGALIERMQAADARAQRYRSRCPVEASDVEAAGVTRAQCRAWLLGLDGVSVPDWSVDEGGSVPNGLIVVWTDDGSGDTETIYFDAGGASAIASVIRDAQPYAGDGDVAQLDILEEMAAMPGASAEGADQ